MRPGGRAAARALFGVLALLCGLAAAAAPADAATAVPAWAPTDVFTLGSAPANPSPDKYSHPAVWEFAEGSGLDTSTYRTLTNYSPSNCAISGLADFADPAGLPAVYYNGTGADITNTGGTCSSPFTIPRGGVAVHPYSSDVILKWTAPVDGTLSVSGLLSDADTNGGNGVSWSIGVRQPNSSSVATLLASGSFGNGGSATLPTPLLADIPAFKGTQLVLVVNENGDPNFDLTDVSLSIVATATTTVNPLPNLDGGTFYDSFQGSGNIDHPEGCTTAFNVVDPAGRAYALSAKHCTDNLDGNDLQQRTNNFIAKHQPMTLTTASTYGVVVDVDSELRIATALNCTPPTNSSTTPIYNTAKTCLLPRSVEPKNGDVYAFAPDPSTTLSSSVQTGRGVLPVLGVKAMSSLRSTDLVCHYGLGSQHTKGSAEQCGSMANIDPKTGPKPTGSGTYVLNAPSVPGDSGGPVYVYQPDRAHATGVWAVGVDLQTGGGQTVVLGITDAMSKLGGVKLKPR